MHAYVLTSAVTLLTMLLYFWVTLRVGMARGRYGIKAPAVSGNVEFECYFRVQQNTLEQMLLFLPSLWMFAVFQSDLWAASLGVAWLVGRILYAVAYTRAPEKRGAGFSIGLLASLVLLIGALIGCATALMSS